jgi:hypothetical protein
MTFSDRQHHQQVLFGLRKIAHRGTAPRGIRHGGNMDTKVEAVARLGWMRLKIRVGCAQRCVARDKVVGTP